MATAYIIITELGDPLIVKRSKKEVSEYLNVKKCGINNWFYNHWLHILNGRLIIKAEIPKMFTKNRTKTIKK